MSESPIPIVRVTVTELRTLFNGLDFPSRTVCGEVIEIITHTGTPSPEVHLPPGSRSELISYFDAEGNELARAHRYVRPDGTVGASGMPDPKRVIKDGIMYRLEKKKES